MNSYAKQMQKYTRQFEKTTGKTAYTAKEAAKWIIENGLWKPPEMMAIQRCADDLSRTWREEYTVDSQGRRVRTRHVVIISDEGEQLGLWGDWNRVPRKHMVLSFQGRRKNILSECRQLKNDVDSYNENLNKEAPIQVIFNFTYDLEELEAGAAKKKISANEREMLVERFPVAARRSASERVLSRL